MAFDPTPHVAINAREDVAEQILAVLARTNAILPGHFALHRGRHAPLALRFRAIARDPASLALVSSALLEQARWSWDDVTIISPETAGFFLGDALARKTGRPHAVVNTDLRRLPTDRLIAGSIESGTPAVIVNDVAGTDKNLAPILRLLSERGAILRGVLVFAVVGSDAFLRFCHREKTQGAWLVAAQWVSVEKGPETCTGCRDRRPTTPIAEFS
jgi:orotate phosphoribosyltransferase